MAKQSSKRSNLPGNLKFLLAEALITSAWVKLSLCFFPFTKVLTWMGAIHGESDYLADEQSAPVRSNIKSALRLCRRYALWPTECYTLAITGKILLKRRKINSTMYIGFRKSPEGKFEGHAWLRAHDTYITGFQESAGFSANITFS
ncbi:lasso peptide biosynthesis B2 protein [Mucilaginibacter sp. Bleaf8]|uniref:lasso peptide biosynthesis B2 protein n=1 Tax=Mucilaginibacter sp. Bleaf8 TaxID=2834430 RepID=UPI001BCC9D46|nr:lasso peptide biosynthesis B2 protein [Mucilaginibacter sp. Bleaf8]MBS7563856.1 lasso peptide biosynthesis B2 protein [Mucilaginibacter sp. Bleaf8]